MNYYKIVNFLNAGIADYKGLKLDKNVPGSQLYLMNEVYLANKDTDKVEHKDLIELTQEEYIQFKEKYYKNINEEQLKITDKETNEKEVFTKALAQLTIESKKKDVMIGQLAQQVSSLTIEITKMKEGNK